MEVNINTIIAARTKEAKTMLRQGVDPAVVYEILVPAILAANARPQMPLVSPTTELENLLRIKAGWDPSALNPSWTTADWGPC